MASHLDLCGGVHSPSVHYTVCLCDVTVPSPCGETSMCMQFCLLTRNTENTGLGYRCGCQVGYTLRDDKMECSPVKEFLMYSQQKFIKGQVGHIRSRC